MFSVKSEFDCKLLKTFLIPDVDTKKIVLKPVAKDILCINSLDAALRQVKNLFRYIVVSLGKGKDRFTNYQKGVGFHLAAGCSMLAGVLDGMAFLDHDDSCTAADNINVAFNSMTFSSPDAAEVQKRIQNLRSPRKASENQAHADFFKIAEFWNKFMPLLPVCHYFPERRLYDLRLELNDDGFENAESATCDFSGPIVHDLLIPTYDGACNILHILAEQRGVDIDCLNYDEDRVSMLYVEK